MRFMQVIDIYKTHPTKNRKNPQNPAKSVKYSVSERYLMRKVLME